MYKKNVRLSIPFKNVCLNRRFVRDHSKPQALKGMGCIIILIRGGEKKTIHTEVTEKCIPPFFFLILFLYKLLLKRCAF